MPGTKSASNRKQSAIGFSDAGICYVESSLRTGARPEITNWQFVPVSSGSPGEIGSALKKLIRNAHIKRRKVNTYLDPDNYFLLYEERPKVPEEELLAALQWQIKDNIDIPVDDMVLDTFGCFNEQANRNGVEHVYVVVARDQVIEEKINAFESAGVKVQSIDIRELAQSKLARALNPGSDNIGVLNIERNTSLLTISNRDSLQLGRRINLQLKQPNFAESLLNELQRSLEYFENTHSARVSRIHVILPHNAVPELSTALNNGLSTPWEMAHLERSLNWKTPIPPEIAASFALTIGSTLA